MVENSGCFVHRCSFPMRTAALTMLIICLFFAAALANRPPVARISVEVDRETSPHVYTFDAANSSDSDGSIERYAWDFGDGSGSVHSVATHSYSARGSYDVSVVVIDDAGASTMATRRVIVSDASVNPSTVSRFQGKSSRAGNPGSLKTILIILAAVVVLALSVVALFRFKRAHAPTEDWRSFEFRVAERFRKDGWRADVTPGSKDGGCDIRLRRKGREVIVECKYWKETSNVGVKDVRALYGVLSSERGASKAIFVTTSNFTADAQAFAVGKSKLELVNGKRLNRWMSSSMNLEDA